MKPYETNVSSPYGAPMGRRSDKNLVGPLRLARVPARDGGDYDPGGAYWGDIAGRYGSAPLWCAWNDDGAIFVRGLDRVIVKALIAATNPSVRFYR